jgi:hypothetical protein
MSVVRRVQLLAVVVLAAGVLGGCVYDPYTGTYGPCCGYYGYPYYGYPYYRYPPPYYYGSQTVPYGAAPPSGYTAPPPGQPGTYPNSQQAQPLLPPP